MPTAQRPTARDRLSQTGAKVPTRMSFVQTQLQRMWHVMPIFDKVITYSVSINQNNFHHNFRQIRLSLESGETAWIAFPKQRPTDWLQIGGSVTTLYMTEDEFADVYHLIQSENPVFFTALKFIGFEVASVHTELDLSAGETPGEGAEDPQSLESLEAL